VGLKAAVTHGGEDSVVYRGQALVSRETAATLHLLRLCFLFLPADKASNQQGIQPLSKYETSCEDNRW
jgi:hypothetical protein